MYSVKGNTTESDLFVRVRACRTYWGWNAIDKLAGVKTNDCPNMTEKKNQSDKQLTSSEQEH